MINSKKTITAGQAGIIMFVLLFSNKILILPSLLFERAKFEGIFVPVILSLLELLLLFVFYKLKTKFPTESFGEIVKQRFGRIFNVVLFIGITFFFLCKTVLLYNVTYVFFNNIIYTDTRHFVYIFCILPIINHLAYSGLRTIGRTIQLFFPVVLSLVLFCIVVGFFDVTSSVLLFQGSLSDVVMTTLRYITAFGDTIFLFVVMDKIEIKKGQWKKVFSLVGLALFLVILITVVFILSYTYTSFMHPFAVFDIMSYVKEYGGLGRIDIFSMILIILLTYFHFALYFKGFMVSFRELMPKLEKTYSIIVFNILLVVFINFIIQNLNEAISYAERIMSYLSIISFVIVPTISMICVFRKKKRAGMKK